MALHNNKVIVFTNIHRFLAGEITYLILAHITDTRSWVEVLVGLVVAEAVVDSVNASELLALLNKREVKEADKPMGDTVGCLRKLAPGEVAAAVKDSAHSHSWYHCVSGTVAFP